MTYTEEQRKRLEELLQSDRRRAVRSLERSSARLSDVDADQERFAFSTHMADQGTNANARESAFLLASEEGRRLVAIDAALRKLYTRPESFGSCEACGETIAYARLEAVPYAVRCIDCQVEQEAKA
ncbi:MAG: TraR/DksA family transcriptional regulator [Gemmatimonadota bacterium]